MICTIKKFGLSKVNAIPYVVLDTPLGIAYHPLGIHLNGKLISRLLDIKENEPIEEFDKRYIGKKLSCDIDSSKEFSFNKTYTRVNIKQVFELLPD